MLFRDGQLTTLGCWLFLPAVVLFWLMCQGLLLANRLYRYTSNHVYAP